MRLQLAAIATALALSACAPSDGPDARKPSAKEPAAPATLVPGELDPWSDALVLGPVDGYAAAGGAEVAASWEGASWLWTSTDEPSQLSLTEGPVSAAARTAEGLWLVLDGELLLHDEVLREVSWAAQLDGSIQTLLAVGERLWIQTDTALYSRHGGRLSSMTLDGAAPGGAVAAGGRIGTADVLWAASGTLAVALDASTGEVVEGIELGAPVTDLSVDGANRTHALAGGVVHLRSGGLWGPLLVEPALEPVRALHAHPDAIGAWLRTDSGWLHHGAESLDHVVDLELFDAAEIDGLGRLLHADGAGLWRHAARRPVELVGIDRRARIDAPLAFSLVPTAPQTLTGLTASLVRGDEVIEVPLDADLRGTIDPLGLVFGQWALQLDTTHSDAGPHRTEWTLKMAAASGATWTEHVQPIYAERCSMCHDDDTETVLATRGQWESSIDAILEKVISGEMPLVGPDLDSSQIALIQAWAAGGFPE